jgi:hypothetical protein
LERSIDEETRETAGDVVHWTYGTAWGIFYGIMQGTSKLPHMAHGLFFGGLVGGVGAAVLPAMRLAPPPRERPPQQMAMNMGMHLLYGVVTALAFALLSPDNG